VIAVLSPHLDDAVLSCWSVLTAPEPVLVVNVFTGSPPPGSGARWWDRVTGASDSASRMRERLAEDRAALALAGREALHLDLLEVQYRDGVAPPDLEQVIDGVLPAGYALYAPAALGDHADHALVRDAALALQVGGTAVTLYADLPHAIEDGWPTLVAGEAGDERVDAGWDAVLAPTGVVATAASVRELDLEAWARKVDAVRAYTSQYPALDALAFRPLLHPDTLRYEVFWAIAPGVRCGGRGALRR